MDAIADRLTELRRDKEFVFNGEIFVLQPTEPKVRHLQAAIAVPRKPGPAGYARSYEHPSAALVRATLINGATNIRRTALPNIGNDRNDGYEWVASTYANRWPHCHR